MPVHNILDHMQLANHSVPRPKAGTRDTICFTCTVQDGIGDFIHLYQLALGIIDDFRQYRTALILDMSGYNKGALQLLLNSINALEVLFDQIYIRVRVNSRPTYTILNPKRFYHDTLTFWDQLEANFKSVITTRVIEKYSKLENVTAIAKRCCLVINVSSVLVFEGKYKENPEHLGFIETLYEKRFRNIPIISFNEHGSFTGIVYEQAEGSLVAKIAANTNAVPHDIYNANMGIADKCVGIRVYTDYAIQPTSNQVAGVSNLQLRQLLSECVTQNDRHIAIAFLRSDWFNAIFITTQIRRALRDNDKLDIYIPKNQYCAVDMKVVFHCLAVELKLPQLPIEIVTSADKIPSSQIRIITHGYYCDDDYDMLWRCADYATSASGDDSFCRALSSPALPMLTYNAHVKKHALFKLCKYILEQQLPAFNNYFTESSFKDFPKYDALNCPFKPEDKHKPVREMQITLILTMSKNISAAINQAALTQWQQLRKSIAENRDLATTTKAIVNVGLQLAKQKGLIQEPICCKTLYPSSRVATLFSRSFIKRQMDEALARATVTVDIKQQGVTF